MALRTLIRDAGKRDGEAQPAAWRAESQKIQAAHRERQHG
jgi:hypothetical protein